MSAVLKEVPEIKQEIDLMDELMRCRGWIEGALRYSGLSESHTFQDICRGVLNGDLHLWQGKDGCAVTEFTVYPTKKVMHVFLAGGKMQQILDFEESAAIWGKACGCTEMTLAGRKGWTKILGDRGWTEIHTVMGRKL
jgi:hypothetical protein